MRLKTIGRWTNLDEGGITTPVIDIVCPYLIKLEQSPGKVLSTWQTEIHREPGDIVTRCGSTRLHVSVKLKPYKHDYNDLGWKKWRSDWLMLEELELSYGPRTTWTTYRSYMRISFQNIGDWFAVFCFVVSIWSISVWVTSWAETTPHHGFVQVS